VNARRLFAGAVLRSVDPTAGWGDNFLSDQIATVSSLHATASRRGTGAAVERQGLAQAGGFGGADAVLDAGALPVA
jgi:hypothetical protein